MSGGCAEGVRKYFLSYVHEVSGAGFKDDIVLDDILQRTELAIGIVSLWLLVNRLARLNWLLVRRLRIWLDRLR